MDTSSDLLTARPLTTSSVLFGPESKLRISQPNMLRSSTTLRPMQKLEKDNETFNPELSIIEVENILRAKVKSNYANLLQGFRSYDINRLDAVSKGEFRRVLDAFAMHLSTEQFESVIAKVPTDRSGALLYIDFLDKFYGSNRISKDEWASGGYRLLQAPIKQPPEINYDQVEKQLVDKIKGNAKDFVKAFHLYDYNRDGKIQRHDFRKVLDNNAIKLNDAQFDKLWIRHDFHHTGTIDYKEFLRKIGVKILAPIRKESQSAPALGVVMKSPPKTESFTHNIDQLDKEFRSRMKSNYVNVKRAMAACDRHNDGFISLEDLHAVLSAFTVPMSEQLFHKLMERAEIKASGKVCWGVVLSKFQDPLSHGNGQTIPIKPAHKYFPVKQKNEEASSDELWALLHKHVTSAYGSFKNAFLQMDENRTGKLTRKNVKKVLQNFKVKLSKKQLNKLMKRLDPENSNSIDYHSFLNVFEVRETEEGHKWLKSEHRYNDVEKPLVLAWDMVNDILKEQITEKWNFLASKFKSYDPLNSAKINKTYLRKIITQFCIPISNEHFDYMMSQIKDTDGDKVNYIEWLAKLGVDVKPGDIAGLSTQIFNDHNKEMDKRFNDQMARHSETDQRILERTSFMSAEEILIRLRDRMLQHRKNIREAFLDFDVKKSGKVSKSDFKKVLALQGFLLDDESFSQLCNLLKFNNGSINYHAFITAFDDPRGNSLPTEEVKRQSNHVVYKHRGDELGMTAEQAERKLRSKLSENFADLRGAFYKFDADHNGLLSKSDFRRMLDAFMIILSDGEFNKLCEKLGLGSNKTKISYKDFLDIFEVIDSSDGHKWLVSDHRFNNVKDIPYLTADYVYGVIAQKGHRQWADLSKAFISMDTNRSGIITKKNLRELLHRFILPMTEEEFSKLWRMYDSTNSGSMKHEDFLQKIGVSFAPGDNMGISKNIVENSIRNLEDHHANLNIKHEQQLYNQANAAWNMSVDSVYNQLKDKIRDEYSDFYTAFRNYDQSKSGSLSTEDMRKVLIDKKYYLSDDQFSQLMQRLGFASLKDTLNYSQFLKAFEEGRVDGYDPAAADVTYLRQFDHLSPEKSDAKLRKYATEQAAALTAIFQAIDKENTGHVPVGDFRRVLDSFCFKMTDVQFKSVINKLRSTGDGKINYPAFLDAYNSGTSAEKIDFNDRLLSDLKTPNDGLSGESFLQSLRDAVNNKFYYIARHFTEIDYAKIGVVSKDDFYDVIAKHCFRMTPTQHENLWQMLKVNQFGNVDYKDFLKLFSSNQFVRESGAADGRPSTANRPATQMSHTYEREQMFSRSQSRAASRAPSRAGAVTPLVNAQDIEARIQATVGRNWKRFQDQCRLWDPEGTGEIEVSQFKDLSLKLNFGLESSDFHVLCTKYDINNNGRFCYSHFLKHFVLTMTPKPEKLEKEIQPAAEPVKVRTPGLTSDQFYNAMLRIKDNILTNWKDMRRSFKKHDPNNSGGVVPSHFRNVLRQYNVNLTEDEFYHLMTYFDKGMTGNISYNDFITHFLKAVQ